MAGLDTFLCIYYSIVNHDQQLFVVLPASLVFLEDWDKESFISIIVYLNDGDRE